MKHAEVDEALARTLDDHRLSRSERRALSEVLADLALSEEDLTALRSRAFDLARAELARHEDRELLDWLEEVVKVLGRAAGPSVASCHAEALFSGRDDCPARVVELVGAARRSLEVCVFTITDDRIARALLAAHRRGVGLRVITDDDKALDRGSDVGRLQDAGVPVRFDRSEAHMHHKFALFDGELLLTGSYNWTRGAADDNEENFVVLGDPRVVSDFTRAFEALWARLT